MSGVLCCGEALIDFISLESGKNISQTTKFSKNAGGAPLNVSGAIRKYTANIYFVSCIGSDSFGDYLIEFLNENKITTKYIQKSNLKTTLAFVSLKKSGERSFEFIRGADSDLTFSKIPKTILVSSSIFHFSSATAFLGGNFEKAYFELLSYAKKNQKMITFDPNYRFDLIKDRKSDFIAKSKRFIRCSDIVKLSFEEAKLISGKRTLENSCNRILEIGAKNVFITLGEKGVYFATKKRRVLIPVGKVKSIDTTGAGDIFIGSLIGQIVSSKKKLSFEFLGDCARNASKIAAISTTKFGGMQNFYFKKYMDK